MRLGAWLLISRVMPRRPYRALAAKTYDLILLDIQLPGEDGYSIARRLRRGGEGLGHGGVPLVAITANAMSGERERCLVDAGMNDFSRPNRCAWIN